MSEKKRGQIKAGQQKGSLGGSFQSPADDQRYSEEQLVDNVGLCILTPLVPKS